MKRKFWGVNGSIPHSEAMKKIRATPSEQAIYLYLENRQLKGKGPATREEIIDYLGFSESTIKRALNQLRRKELIEEARVETIALRPTTTEDR